MARPTLLGHIERLKGIREQLAKPADFFASHREEYVAALREITVRELMLIKPDDQEDEEWGFHVQVVADCITSALIFELETGLRFWLSPEAQPQIEEVAGPTRIFAQDTVQEWVAAGRAGEDGGKDLDDRDIGKSDAEIAKRVWWAMYEGRSLNSHDRIRAFLIAQGIDLMREALPSLLNAWKQNIVVPMRKDWRKYVGEVVRGKVKVPF